MHTAERVTLARLASGAPVETTVHVYEGDSGPTLYVQAAQHGHEVNGTEVLRRVHDRLVDAAADGDLAGRVVAVPVADPLSFDRVSYTVSRAIDARNANMNRAWPGDPEGTIHERMAARLWAYAGDADAIVDLHTGSPDTVTHAVYLAGDRRCRGLAEAFGTDLLLAEPAGEDADEEWTDRNFDGKLRVAATRAGIPAVTPELASNRRIVESAVETGVRGVTNVLRHLDMLPGDPEMSRDGKPTVARNHLGRVKAVDSGLFVPGDGATLGRAVEAGDRLGRLYDPTTYEVLQEVEADREGVLYSVTRRATVSAGRSLVGVAERVEA